MIAYQFRKNWLIGGYFLAKAILTNEYRSTIPRHGRVISRAQATLN